MDIENDDLTDSQVVWQSSAGFETRANLLRLTRYSAVFESYGSDTIIRTSDLLDGFRILIGDRIAYAGRALINKVITTGTVHVCEVKLEESGLNVAPLSSAASSGGALVHSFNEFVRAWQRFYRVRPDFKDVMADLQGFLSDLQIWLDQVELEIRSSASADRQQMERRVIDELAEPIVRSIDSFIERFEAVAEELEEELRPVHRSFLRRQLHPLMMCSPFAYRAFHKPLGYAGDYEIVDMMMRPPYEGSTLFAKVLNVWLLGQAPARAHRHRVEYLERKLFEEALAAHLRRRTARVYNLGCGPATEVQRFIENQPLANQTDFTLVDFNEETLAHARAKLEKAKQTHGRSTHISYVRRSVQGLLKDSVRSATQTQRNLYDFIYCAGLFDYLPGGVCRRLMSIFYEMLAPKGLLVATNVCAAMNRSRPFRHSMDYILDWHLIYRNGPDMMTLVPERATVDRAVVHAEESGVNLFVELRKPEHG